MFSNVGWGEVLLLFVVGLVVIGPERLPRVIGDLRAALVAARTAINNAKQSLDQDFGSEFDEIRKPLSQVAQYTQMGPKAALSKALFDGDNSALDDFDPKKIMAEDTAGAAQRRQEARPGPTPEQATVVERPEKNTRPGPDYGGGASWTDIL